MTSKCHFLFYCSAFRKGLRTGKWRFLAAVWYVNPLVYQWVSGCCVLIARNGDGWWMRNCKTTVSGCVRSCDRQRQRRERYRTNSTQPAANCSPTSASYYHKTKFTKIKWHSNILFTYMKYIATWWQLNEETTSWQLQEENNESLSLELSSFVSITLSSYVNFSALLICKPRAYTRRWCVAYNDSLRLCSASFRGCQRDTACISCRGALSSKPATRGCYCQSMEQTDGRTDARPFHRPYSA